MRTDYNLAKQQDYTAALYCRLSRDDGTESESNSINTQRQILRRFAREHGYTVYDEYVDDGYSGTTFDRPGFKRMMGDIESGKVNIVLTKDLSRLGRNNAIVAHYTEIYFPENDVRFIAVTDGIDTFRDDNEIMPFKSVVNEFYARDISKKTRSAFKIKAQNGEFTGSLPPYGYKKDPDNKHRLIPDENTAGIARRIFELAVEGYNPYKIAQVLKKEKVPKPRVYAACQEGKSGSDGIFKYPYKWCDSSIVKIIRNQAYLGHMVSHKNVTKSYKIKKRVDIPKTDWIEVKNTHEPLVDEETFELAQKVIKVKKRADKNGNVQIFSGLLKCSTCGSGMAYSNHKSYKNPYAFYVCSNARRNGKDACTLHYINYNDLYAVVLDDIQRNTRLAAGNEKEFLEHVTKINKDKQKFQMAKSSKEIAKSNKRISELDLIIKRLYEDNVLGKVSDERFIALTKDNETEQRELKKGVEELQAQMQEIEARSENTYKFLELIRRYTDITELTAPMLKELVDHIVIHQSSKTGGKRSQRVDIYYRFIGSI
jgi:site-specific DNA recombinase